MKQVELYTTSRDVDGLIVRNFLNRNGINFIEYDVNTDDVKRKEMMSLSGQVVVPVIVVEGQVITGFDEDKLKEVLEIK